MLNGRTTHGIISWDKMGQIVLNFLKIGVARQQTSSNSHEGFVKNDHDPFQIKPTTFGQKKKISLIAHLCLKNIKKKIRQYFLNNSGF